MYKYLRPHLSEKRLTAAHFKGILWVKTTELYIWLSRLIHYLCSSLFVIGMLYESVRFDFYMGVAVFKWPTAGDASVIVAIFLFPFMSRALATIFWCGGWISSPECPRLKTCPSFKLGDIRHRTMGSQLLISVNC